MDEIVKLIKKSFRGDQKIDLAKHDNWVLLRGACDAAALFNIKKILPRDSSSRTMQFFAEVNVDSFPTVVKKLTEKEVFVKAIPDIDTQKNLMTEIYVYRLVSLIKDIGACPHFISYLADFSCSITPELQKEFSSRRMNPSVVHFLVTEKSKFTDESLNYEQFSRKLIKDNGSSLMFTTMFQVLYTLYQLNLAGIRHNDCHTQNIFVEEVKNRDFAYYVIDKRTIVKIPYLVSVKIYDYDHATFTDGAKDLMDMTFVDYMCKTNNECDREDFKTDPFIFLNFVYNFYSNGEVKNVIEQIIRKPALLEMGLNEYKYRHFAHYCHVDNVTKTDSECSSRKITDSEMLPFKRAIKKIPGLVFLSLQEFKKEASLLEGIFTDKNFPLYVSLEYEGGKDQFLDDILHS